MAIQSRLQPVPLLLTRPAAQGTGFADAVVRRFGDRVQIIETPLMAPRFFVPALPEGPFRALILTSQTGVEAASRMGTSAMGLPREVYCVGEQTAAMAQANGFFPLDVAATAAALIMRILAIAPDGRLLHLRGQDARGEVAKTLVLAGTDTVEAITYAQMAQHLTPAAVVALQATSPVIVPLFSPRSASIFASEVARIVRVSPLFIAVMSGDVALDAPPSDTQVRVAVRPDADAMLQAVAMLLADIART